MTAKPAAAAARATVYGYPRQGQSRELKKAVEGYWKGRVTADALRETAAELRRTTWRQLADAGIHEVPTGDFSYYDHVLDTSVMVGAIPARHREAAEADALDGYFAMARGTQDVAPLEMTKWFDTNYHYLVPELGPDTVFSADSAKQVAEFGEARALGHTPRPVLVGPVTYLLLAKAAPGVAADFDPLTLLDRLLPVYAEVIADLRAAGAEWVQLDEPALVQDRAPAELNAAARAYRGLGALTDRPKLLVASYFGRLGEALPVLAKAPVDGLALDFTETGAGNLDDLAAAGWTARQAPGRRLSSTAATSGSTTWRSRSPPSAPSSASPTGSTSPPPAPSCTSRSTPQPSATSTRRSCAGSPSPARRPPNWSPWPRACPAARTPSRANSPPTAPIWPPGPAPPSPATRPSGPVRRPSPTPTAAAPSRTPSGPRPSAPTSGCRRCRPPPSARSRRPPNCAPRGPTCGRAGSTRPGTRSGSRTRSARSSPSRRRPGSTCSCTASPNATTWSSTSPSTSPATSPPSTAGSSPTAPATSARRSSPGTSRAPSR